MGSNIDFRIYSSSTTISLSLVPVRTFSFLPNTPLNVGPTKGEPSLVWHPLHPLAFISSNPRGSFLAIFSVGISLLYHSLNFSSGITSAFASMYECRRPQYSAQKTSYGPNSAGVNHA